MVSAARSTTGRSPRPCDPRATVSVTLGNGLRVLAIEERAVGLVCVAVCYGVGSRSEEPGRTGLAHLFEHLMFQGSAAVGKMRHVLEVEAAGGTLNASARPDYTNYWQIVPPDALEQVLALEADRMRGPDLRPENLANQVHVVKEEIRVNVHNQPYIGFPWFVLPGFLFDSFPNAHPPYGVPEDLDTVSLADARDFFRRFYSPGNAVLAVAGDIDGSRTLRAVQRYFGDIAPGPVAPPSHAPEPPLAQHRRAQVMAPAAPAPALALAWRLAVDADALQDFLAYVVLARVLAGDRASWLRRRLVSAGLATHVSAGVGFDDRDAFDVRGPVALVLEAYLRPGADADRLVALVGEDVGQVARHGVPDAAIMAARGQLAVERYSRLDRLEYRTLLCAYRELRGVHTGVADDLGGCLARVGVSEVGQAAARLRDSGRLRLDLVAGGTP